MISIAGSLAAHNEQTRSKSSQEDIVLSASAISNPDKTFAGDYLQSAGSVNVRRTRDAVRLESSRSLGDRPTDDGSNHVTEGTDNDERSYARNSVASEPLGDDVLTSSKLVDQIDGNQIEVKPGKYYRCV